MVYSIPLPVLDCYGKLRQRSLQASPKTACEETLPQSFEINMKTEKENPVSELLQCFTALLMFAGI